MLSHIRVISEQEVLIFFLQLKMPPSVHSVGWESQADSFSLRVLPANQDWGPSGHSEEMGSGVCNHCLMTICTPLLLSRLPTWKATYMYKCGNYFLKIFSNNATFWELMLGFNCLFRKLNKTFFLLLLLFCNRDWHCAASKSDAMKNSDRQLQLSSKMCIFKGKITEEKLCCFAPPSHI